MQKLIDRYNLISHPEGGYYREVYRSEQTLYSAVAGRERCALTHIYFLLATGQVSRFHKVVHDEVWNFYAGAPLRLIRYNGEQVTEAILGAAAGEFVTVVAGGVFQAAETTGAFSLVGCTVAPRFAFEDFALLGEDPARKRKLLDKFPACQKFV